MREPGWLQLILKISISQNTNWDKLVGFPKSGHIYYTTSVHSKKVCFGFHHHYQKKQYDNIHVSVPLKATDAWNVYFKFYCFIVKTSCCKYCSIWL